MYRYARLRILLESVQETDNFTVAEAVHTHGGVNKAQLSRYCLNYQYESIRYCNQQRACGSVMNNEQHSDTYVGTPCGHLLLLQNFEPLLDDILWREGSIFKGQVSYHDALVGELFDFVARFAHADHHRDVVFLELLE